MIDHTLGAAIPTAVNGEVTLADGWCEHYIRLEAGAKSRKEKLEASAEFALLRLLAYSWRDIGFRYEKLTMHEKSLITEAQFKLLVERLEEHDLTNIPTDHPAS